MLSLNFRFTARFVPLKVYRGHSHPLQVPPAPPLPHTVALFSYQEEPFCLLCIYHRVSVYLLDTIQTLLTYLYYETESSEFFSNTHEISTLLATFYLRAHGFCNSCSQLKPAFQVLLINIFTLKTKAVSSSTEINTLTWPATYIMQHFLFLSWQPALNPSNCIAKSQPLTKYF